MPLCGRGQRSPRRRAEVFGAEGWHHVQLVYEVKRLGVWQGPDVTGGRIWRDAIAKAIARVGLWRKSAWAMNVMAIIWRGFIVTLFSYLSRFHSYPAHAHTELNQMPFQAARWTDSGGLYDLWWVD